MMNKERGRHVSATQTPASLYIPQPFEIKERCKKDTGRAGKV